MTAFHLLLLLLYLRFLRPQRLRKRLRFYHLGHLWNMSKMYVIYGGLRLMKSAAAYGGLQRRLEALTIARRTLQRTRAGIRSNFIHRIVTYPDLSVTCYNPGLVEVFTSLLSSSTDQDKPTVTVTYDTTFNLGDYYVSVLLFLVFDCCLYCSLLLRCRLTPGFLTSATPHFTR